MSRTTNLQLTNRHHFLVLDALRGVAAISVATYHACIIFGAEQLLPKAFLAVDFFFLLSGIVVVHMEYPLAERWRLFLRRPHALTNKVVR